jgi:hypothetical protein
VVSLSHRTGQWPLFPNFRQTSFAAPKGVGYDAYEGLECGDKSPCEQVLADSTTTLLRGMGEGTRPASQRESEGERRQTVPIRFGVFVPQGWRMDLAEIEDPIEQYETMTRVARAADEGGWDSIWVFDHFHTVPTPELETCFECWTSTATLARDTQNVKIGQMVGCNG